MTTLTLDRHIVSTPGTLGGRPLIAGRRIAVIHIAAWHLQQDMSVTVICAEFNLSPSEVHVALAYYYDHRAEIDRRAAEDAAFVAALKAKTPSLLAK